MHVTMGEKEKCLCGIDFLNRTLVYDCTIVLRSLSNKCNTTLYNIMLLKRATTHSESANSFATQLVFNSTTIEYNQNDFSNSTSTLVLQLDGMRKPERRMSISHKILKVWSKSVWNTILLFRQILIWFLIRICNVNSRGWQC